MMPLSKAALDVLFNEARTYSTWEDRPVDPELFRHIYELARMGPTSANCQPMRVVFAVSAEAKEKLKPCLSPGNVDKTMSAPATAVIGMDMRFYDKLPKWFPHTDAKSWFEGNDAHIQDTAFRNSSLQGAYFILAARAVGLDCGPMSGFDAAAVDAAFFEGTTIRTNFLCNLGYGDVAGLHPRSPRPAFDEACAVV